MVTLKLWVVLAVLLMLVLLGACVNEASDLENPVARTLSLEDEVVTPTQVIASTQIPDEGLSSPTPVATDLIMPNVTATPWPVSTSVLPGNILVPDLPGVFAPMEIWSC